MPAVNTSWEQSTTEKTVFNLLSLQASKPGQRLEAGGTGPQQGYSLKEPQSGSVVSTE